jgi:hypothetical protein
LGVYANSVFNKTRFFESRHFAESYGVADYFLWNIQLFNLCNREHLLFCIERPADSRGFFCFVRDGGRSYRQVHVRELGRGGGGSS